MKLPNLPKADRILAPHGGWKSRARVQQTPSGLAGGGWILALIAGCGSSSRGSAPGVDPGHDNPAPLVTLVFPPPFSHTDDDGILVTGTAHDPDGVVEVRVNGVPASSSDGFATWRASLRLAPGANDLTVAAWDARGAVDPSAAKARIESQAVLLFPLGVAVDAPLDRALVTDLGLAAVVAVDLTSGVRTILSGAAGGAGPAFVNPVDVALDGGRALVTDSGLPAVLELDLATGDRRILTGGFTGSGPRMQAPSGITTLDSQRAVLADGARLVSVEHASGVRTVLSGDSTGAGPTFPLPVDLELDAGRVLVLDAYAGLLAVDPADGTRALLSGAGMGSGPELAFAQGLALDGGQALVSAFVLAGETSRSAVLTIDLASGDRALLSGLDVGSGPELSGAGGLALDARRRRALVMDAGRRELVAVDLASGARSVLSSSSIGSGQPLTYLLELAVEREVVLAIDQGLPGVVRIDPASGARTIQSSLTVGTGPALDYPAGIALDLERGRALVLNYPSALFALDLATGERTLLSDAATGSGPTFFVNSFTPSDLVLDGERALFLADFDEGGSFHTGLMAVDLASGDRSVLSSPSVGSGPSLGFPVGLVRDGERLLTLASVELSGLFELAVVALDPLSGDRSLVTRTSTGSGPALLSASGLALQGERLLVTTVDELGFQPALMSIDLATGARRLISSPAHGGGPRFQSPLGIALDGERALVADSGLGALVAVDLRFGQRALASR